MSIEGCDYDLIVIGGGPAGQAACLALKGRLAKVAVIDEQLRPGGQILRQPPAAFSVSNWLAGRDYRRLQAQLRAFQSMADIDWLGGRSVLGVRRDGAVWSVLASDGRKAAVFRARRVLVATGCYDMTAPLPGWTLPGVMSAGAVQAFVKSQRLVPGRRIAMAGTHPLQLLVAEQIIEAGGEVAVVAFSQKFSVALGKVLKRPGAVLENALRLLGVLWGALCLARVGVRIRFDDRPVRVLGEAEVRGLRLARTGEVACDAAAFCFGFLPQSDLIRAMGLDVVPGRFGGWSARHDEWMRASQDGVYVAGETVGVKGAEAASAEGALAGVAIALDAARIDAGQAAAEARRPRARRARALRFAALLDDIADPGDFQRLEQPADTIACRCEDVSFGQIDAALRTAPTANAAKLATRCGMGPCQGRNCEHVLLRRLPDSLEKQDGFKARFPARPVRIGEIVPDR